MKDPKHLLDDFPAPTLDQWRHEVERLLKGAPFERKMFTRLWEGLTVAPLYTGADTRDIPWRDSLPGQAPFVRGSRAAGYHGAPWLVAQEHRSPDCAEFNRAVRPALQRGQSAVNLVLDAATRRGLDPDQSSAAEVGGGGTSLCSLTDLATACDGIDLDRYPIQLQSGASFLPAAAMVMALVAGRQGQTDRLHGCLGTDPFAGLARQGRLQAALPQLQAELATLTRWTSERAPQLRTLPVCEAPWHEGGADLALSLGLTLSSAVATLRAMEAHGIPPLEAAPRFQFNLEIGTDFFLEMAKLRALRLLWSRVLTASGVPADRSATFVHARTARRCLSALDPHVNLLRATTGAMSAVLGGTDSLHVSAFDEIGGQPNEFSARIARNVQLILAHECHFDQVTDPAGGSWYIDSLTRDLAAAAWARFQAAEAAGGMPAVLVSGWAQAEVSAAAAKRADAYARRAHIMVGTNMYPAPQASPPQDGGPSAAERHQARTRALAAQRQSATPEAHLLVLARLEKLSTCPPEELFDRLIAAVAAGATVGEYSGVRRDSTPPSLTVTPIPVRRDAAPFEELRRRAARLGESRPGALRVFAACLGDFAAYMPRLEFVRGFFAVAGCEVAGDRFYTTPEDAIAAAGQAGAETVVLVGLDTTYAALAAPTAAGLRHGPRPATVYLAGAPGPDAPDLRAAGVHEFVHLKSSVLDVLAALLTRLEAQS